MPGYMRSVHLASRLRWLAAPAVGLYRSAVLTVVTGLIPVIAAVVGYFSVRAAFSWSAHSHGSLAVLVLAHAGELLSALTWTGLAVWIMLQLAGRPLCQATRRLSRDWLGIAIEPRYHRAVPVTRMTTGFWWNGYEYHRSERTARRQARLASWYRDPQARQDILWFAVAGATVLPAAAMPLLFLMAGILEALMPTRAWYGVALGIAGIAASPFGWRVLEVIGPALLGPPPQQRIAALESLQADMTRSQATELERIERALHDGAQARLIALGMAMGAAENLIDVNPAAAKALLAEARASSATALEELRALVHGINPPVLAERGLVDAVRALALDAPLPVAVTAAVPSRPERPVESALYYAISECLANVAKHGHATKATVELAYASRCLRATVTDDGLGGAVVAGTGVPGSPGGPGGSGGSGLRGIQRRMAAFGGWLTVDSPAGGPTRITMAVPCGL
jgi:signal transduction histidine kinase